jgi:NADH-quinone oxidoreductase subunit N
MKYLVIGAVGSAFTLYGMSFVYGLTGTTNIAKAFEAAGNWSQFTFLGTLSLVMVVAGMGIKISMVPFHMWTPDAYEGAPTPITAFLSAVSKAAAFAALLRIYLFLYFSILPRELAPKIYALISVLAVLTMVVGNVAALTQKNIKRLMAYSSIAQAGYLLVPIAVLGKIQLEAQLMQSISNMVFYLAIYVLMTMGAFAIIQYVTREAVSESIESFRGLFQRSPFLAIAMSVFLLSMAGMPVTAGFFGKFMIILGAVHTQSFWLAGIMFAASVISFYYYFGIIRLIFVKETEGVPDKLGTPLALSVVIGLALIVTVGLGVAPDALLDVLGALKWFGPGQA